MSQENVEATRRAYDAVNRRDLDAFLALMDEEVEAISFLVAMEGEYQGHAGLRRWWQNLLDVFPDFNVELVEVRDGPARAPFPAQPGGDRDIARARPHRARAGAPEDPGQARALSSPALRSVPPGGASDRRGCASGRDPRPQSRSSKRRRFD